VALSTFKKACLQSSTVQCKVRTILICINPEISLSMMIVIATVSGSQVYKSRRGNVDFLLWLMVLPIIPALLQRVMAVHIIVRCCFMSVMCSAG
jgi:hypothetical protein